MSRAEALKKVWPDFLSRNGSGLTPELARAFSSASTAGLVASRTQSRRRNTVKGRITLP
jgi:hypothetical protein